MTRNVDFSAMVVKKLTDQRIASEQNACDVNTLLDEKMTDDLACTAEQKELIKSIISQAIADERKFNERLSNGMLKSLLESLDAQNAKSLESHTAMLQLVRHSRISLFRFYDFMNSVSRSPSNATRLPILPPLKSLD